MATFGNTNIGATWQTDYTDRIYACRYQLTEDGDVTLMSRWGQTAGIGLRMAIYSDNPTGGPGGNPCPNALLAETAEGTTVSNNWASIVISKSLTAGYYWLAWRLNGTCAGKKDAGVTNQHVASTTGQGYEAFPATFPLVAATYSAYANSIYATYTAGAPPAVGGETKMTLTLTMMIRNAILEVLGKKVMPCLRS